MIRDSRSGVRQDHEWLTWLNRCVATNKEIWREVRRNAFEHGREEEPGEVIGWDPLTGEILAQLGVPVHRKVLPGGLISGKSYVLDDMVVGFDAGEVAELGPKKERIGQD